MASFTAFNDGPLKASKGSETFSERSLDEKASGGESESKACDDVSAWSRRQWHALAHEDLGLGFSCRPSDQEMGEAGQQKRKRSRSGSPKRYQPESPQRDGTTIGALHRLPEATRQERSESSLSENEEADDDETLPGGGGGQDEQANGQAEAGSGSHHHSAVPELLPPTLTNLLDSGDGKLRRRELASRSQKDQDYDEQSPEGDDGAGHNVSPDSPQGQRDEGSSLSDLKKRKRNFSNRTKTGCLTCRKRKKKCDEGKPECSNCFRGGFICAGYPPQRGAWLKMDKRPPQVNIESKDPNYIPPGAYGMPQPRPSFGMAGHKREGFLPLNRGQPLLRIDPPLGRPPLQDKTGKSESGGEPDADNDHKTATRSRSRPRPRPRLATDLSLVTPSTAASSRPRSASTILTSPSTDGSRFSAFSAISKHSALSSVFPTPISAKPLSELSDRTPLEFMRIPSFHNISRGAELDDVHPRAPARPPPQQQQAQQVEIKHTPGPTAEQLQVQERRDVAQPSKYETRLVPCHPPPLPPPPTSTVPSRGHASMPHILPSEEALPHARLAGGSQTAPGLQMSRALMAARCPPGRSLGGEKEKMLKGDPYRPSDRELVLDRERCHAACWRFNNSTNPNLGVSALERSRLFRDILSPMDTFLQLSPSATNLLGQSGYVGSETTIEAPFNCDYGYNIFLGSNVLISRNCLINDVCEVRIGNNVIIGPNVCIYTGSCSHDPQARGGNRGTQCGKPVVVEDNVWIAANSIILPGVHVGKGATVLPGSLVEEDQNIAASSVSHGSFSRSYRFP